MSAETLNRGQLMYLLSEADSVILNLVERLTVDNPVESLDPTDIRSVELVGLIAESIAWCDVLRESVNLPTIMGDD